MLFLSTNYCFFASPLLSSKELSFHLTTYFQINTTLPVASNTTCILMNSWIEYMSRASRFIGPTALLAPSVEGPRLCFKLSRFRTDSLLFHRIYTIFFLSQKKKKFNQHPLDYSNQKIGEYSRFVFKSFFLPNWIYLHRARFGSTCTEYCIISPFFACSPSHFFFIWIILLKNPQFYNISDRFSTALFQHCFKNILSISEFGYVVLA